MIVKWRNEQTLEDWRIDVFTEELTKSREHFITLAENKLLFFLVCLKSFHWFRFSRVLRGRKKNTGIKDYDGLENSQKCSSDNREYFALKFFLLWFQKRSIPNVSINWCGFLHSETQLLARKSNSFISSHITSIVLLLSIIEEVHLLLVCLFNREI